MHSPTPNTHPCSPPGLNPSCNHGVTAPRPNSHHSTLTFHTVTVPAASSSTGGPTSPSHGFCCPQPLPSAPKSLREPLGCLWGADEGDSQPWPTLLRRGWLSLVVRGGCCLPSVKAGPPLWRGGPRFGTWGLHQPSGYLEVHGPRANTSSLPPSPGMLQYEGSLESACLDDTLSPFSGSVGSGRRR